MIIPSLGSLVALLGLSRVTVAAQADNYTESDTSCRARAWVRAPDLEPGQVVQGDVKVKLDGHACQEVSNYTLRLRFAERSWVKTRREGVKLPEQPTANHSFEVFPDANENSIFNSGSGVFGFPHYRALDDLVWEKYEDEVKDPSLWLVREEERVGFETKYGLCHGTHIGHDVIESFAILVPSTEYPPAFEPWPWGSFDGGLDAAGSEHIYAYFVDVAFVNGTVLEVPAGYTAFNYPTMVTQLPETVNVTATVGQSTYVDMNGNISEVVEPEDVDVFTLEVTFPYGRHLEPGSVNNITIVSHQVGPGLERPAHIQWLSPAVSQKRHWAASLAADNMTAERLLYPENSHQSQLRPTSPSIEVLHWPRYTFDQDNDLTHPKFEDGAVKNGATISTSPIKALFQMPENCYPPFEMHYQSSEVELTIAMAVQNISTSDDLSSEDPEEFDWIPKLKEMKLPPFRYLSARIQLFVQSKRDELSPESVTTDRVHYLSHEARAPVFVDPATVQKLLHKSPKERNVLSPKAHPHFITHDESDIVKDRYFVSSQLPEMHYVGDTWLRKVVLPGRKDESKALVSGFRVQS